MLIFAIDAKSEDFPGIRKVFCCGKIPIKTSKKSKNCPKNIRGTLFFWSRWVNWPPCTSHLGTIEAVTW